MTLSINKFIERMEWWCTSGNLGYDQWQRNNLFIGGETDCSALVLGVLRECGFPTGDATWTGNMRVSLGVHGWSSYPRTAVSPQAGDILLSTWHHTAVVVTGGRIAQASIDERGMTHGGQAGDQTGRETNITNFYEYPWDYILRFNGLAKEEPLQKDELKIGEHEMFIVSRIGDETGYLVTDFGMKEITYPQAKSLMTAGIKRIHLYPQDVYNMMEALNELNAHNAQIVDNYKAAR